MLQIFYSSINIIFYIASLRDLLYRSLSAVLSCLLLTTDSFLSSRSFFVCRFCSSIGGRSSLCIFLGLRSSLSLSSCLLRCLLTDLFHSEFLSSCCNLLHSLFHLLLS